MEEWKQVAKTATRLREAMDIAGKSQADLVEGTGLNKSSISRYLSGAVEPKQKAITALAKELNVDEMWLWGYDVPRTRTPTQKKNDALVRVVAQLRKDPEFFDVVSMLAELPPEQYASMKQLLTILAKR